LFNFFNILITTTYLYLSNKIKCDIFSVFYVNFSRKWPGLVLFGFMMLNATFINISVIWWLSVLLVEETGVPRENQRPAASHWKTLLDNVVLLALSGRWTHNISSDSKWPGTINTFIIIFQHFSLKKTKWQRFFYMKILKKNSQRKIAFPWGNFKFPTEKSRLLPIHGGMARKSEIVKY
jgi:hypothetical protein